MAKKCDVNYVHWLFCYYSLLLSHQASTSHLTQHNVDLAYSKFTLCLCLVPAHKWIASEACSFQHLTATLEVVGKGIAVAIGYYITGFLFKTS